MVCQDHNNLTIYILYQWAWLKVDSKLTMNWNRFGWIWLRYFHDIQKNLLVYKKPRWSIPVYHFYNTDSWCSTQNVYVSYWGRDIHLKWFKFPVPNGFLKSFRSRSRDIFRKLIRYSKRRKYLDRKFYKLSD